MIVYVWYVYFIFKIIKYKVVLLKNVEIYILVDDVIGSYI